MKIDKFVEIVDCGEEVDFDELMENLSQVDPELQKKPVRKMLSDNFRVLYFRTESKCSTARFASCLWTGRRIKCDIFFQFSKD